MCSEEVSKQTRKMWSEVNATVRSIWCDLRDELGPGVIDTLFLETEPAGRVTISPEGGYSYSAVRVSIVDHEHMEPVRSDQENFERKVYESLREVAVSG